MSKTDKIILYGALLSVVTIIICFTPSILIDVSTAFPGSNGKIAFTSDYEIFVMNPNGSDIEQLTYNPSEDTNPIWSPDGSKIVFLSNRNGDHEIFVMNSNGSGLTQLTYNSDGDFWPAWSDDSSKIVFTNLVFMMPNMS